MNVATKYITVDFGEESGGTAPCILLRLRGHIQDEGERVSAARFIGGLCLCMHVYMCVWTHILTTPTNRMLPTVLFLQSSWWLPHANLPACHYKAGVLVSYVTLDDIRMTQWPLRHAQEEVLPVWVRWCRDGVGLLSRTTFTANEGTLSLCGSVADEWMCCSHNVMKRCFTLVEIKEETNK